MNIDFSQQGNSTASSPNFTDLLYRQQGINIPNTCSQPSIPTSLDETSKDAVPRPRWSVEEETTLVSGWLNTSKDPIIGKEQKAGRFWDRVADYVAASPAVAHLPKREANTCKQKWAKINECVSKFVGCLECTTRIKKSGLQGNDEMVIAYQLYFQDYKMKFTLEHVWRLLLYDQKFTLHLGESTILKCLEHFVDAVIQFFGDEYLRRPTPYDLQRLLDQGESRGFPEMIGSIDCMHWEWKNCPTAWAGQYSRGHGKPTIVLEAVASQDLWIWHAFFGAPGTCNDLNVLDRSPVFDDILEGRAPNVSYFINGRQYDMAYYLTDGIYPEWATFIQSISLPQDPKATLFAERQEGARKDVERAFGVLQARFAIVRNPALSWDKAKIGKIMKASIILHNMIVEDERDQDNESFVEIERNGTSQVDYTFYTTTPTNVNNMMANRARIRARQMHQQLKADLVEHIWNKFGTPEY